MIKYGNVYIKVYGMLLYMVKHIGHQIKMFII